MTDFLLELRSEEIPARMQAKARDDLARLFAAELAKAGLQATDTTTYANPRRLALIARGLPDATQAVSEEVKGPKASAPPQALEGFLRKTGLTREALVERNGTLFAVTQKPGRATAEVLAEAIPTVIRAFPWPKSMRWGAASASTESPRWVRPLQGIVAIFGEDLVAVEAAGVASGYATLGHRFHHPGPITLGGAHDYVEKLRACHVIVDQDERAALIRERAQALATDAGLELVEDEGLVAENAGLTEWPVPLLGRFDEAFLEVPPEVIQLTARVNQKYFVCRTPLPLAGGAGGGPSFSAADTPTPNPSRKREGNLANAFICTANIDATDGGAKIVEGNRKVLAARLSDARFFYDTDLKVPLGSQAKKLQKIVFHEKLGSLADKVERVAKLARWLVEEGIISSPLRGEGGVAADSDLLGASRSREAGSHGEPLAQHGGGGSPQAVSPGMEPPPPPPAAAVPLPVNGEDRARFAALAERAARLAKADLVTGMVGEFPELQGLMGGYYAQAQGEPREVWEAVRDHYKPVGQGDDVPTAPVTVAVSLADKLDTLAAFWVAGILPTGSKDPFALRRASLAALDLCHVNNIRMPLEAVLTRAMSKVARALADAEIKEDDSLVSATLDEGQRVAAEANASERDLEPGEVGERLTLFLSAWSQRIAGEKTSKALASLLPFFADRLKVQQREAGVRHDLIDAVFALGGEDDLVRLLARVRALQAFVGTEDGANLLAGYKRAANILKKEGYTPLPAGEGQGAQAPRGEGERDAAGVSHSPSPDLAALGHPLPRGEGFALSYTPEPAEEALVAALDSAEPAAAQAVAAEDFERAMAALASLRAPIDAFFDSVTVNDPDAVKRAARLALLARVRAAVHTVADFSRIEG